MCDILSDTLAPATVNLIPAFAFMSVSLTAGLTLLFATTVPAGFFPALAFPLALPLAFPLTPSVLAISFSLQNTPMQAPNGSKEAHKRAQQLNFTPSSETTRAARRHAEKLWRN
ncbi:hypothetical protein M758_12G086500 [Ceratodon purpureus]|nr:hypothetical protein M758_12G086500 [Ceratodon purpureus]